MFDLSYPWMYVSFRNDQMSAWLTHLVWNGMKFAYFSYLHKWFLTTVIMQTVLDRHVSMYNPLVFFLFPSQCSGETGFLPLSNNFLCQYQILSLYFILNWQKQRIKKKWRSWRSFVKCIQISKHGPRGCFGIHWKCFKWLLLIWRGTSCTPSSFTLSVLPYTHTQYKIVCSLQRCLY